MAPASSLVYLRELAEPRATPASASSEDPAGGHAHDGRVSVRRPEYAALMSQIRRAAAATCHLLTVHDAEAAGYFLASPYVEGVGTHWINWRIVDRPFDPARPSMLLFGTSDGRTRLAGFSYWVRSATEPAGFPGGLDRWHRHFGLCFEHGEWAGTGVARHDCNGVWLNGSNLWMLHAWIVPHRENVAGVFAPTNRALCRARVPDIVACPRAVRSIDSPPAVALTGG